MTPLQSKAQIFTKELYDKYKIGFGEHETFLRNFVTLFYQFIYVQISDLESQVKKNDPEWGLAFDRSRSKLRVQENSVGHLCIQFVIVDDDDEVAPVIGEDQTIAAGESSVTPPDLSVHPEKGGEEIAAAESTGTAHLSLLDQDQFDDDGHMIVTIVDDDVVEDWQTSGNCIVITSAAQDEETEGNNDVDPIDHLMVDLVSDDDNMDEDDGGDDAEHTGGEQITDKEGAQNPEDG
jgi:hypothetical protein